MKARDDDGRAASCVAAQVQLAEHGFPCARPLTAVTNVGPLAVHAEEFRPGGEVLRGEIARRGRAVCRGLAWLTAELADVSVSPPLPNPRWVRWDHTDAGVWPAIDFLDRRDQRVVPTHVIDTAMPIFEAQNLRRHGRACGRCTTGTVRRGNRRQHR